MFYCALCAIPIETDMAKKNLLGRRYDELLFIYSRFVGLRVLECYISLMYLHGIITNILHLTFAHAEF